MEVLLVSPVKPLFIILAKAVPLFCVVVCQSDHYPFTFGLCAGCSSSRKFILVDNCLFVVYLRILGVGLIDFISHAYTGCGHAGFRFDVDDAHDAFIGDDFPY